jgi:hypothetical protein
MMHEVARKILRTAVSATVPLRSIAAVFYNTWLAPYLCFLLPVVHFLPGRVDLRELSAPEDSR